MLGQPMLMAQLEQQVGAGEAWWSDGGDGYPAGRARLLSQVAERRIEDVVVIGGDIHAFWVTDLKAGFADPGSAPVAGEFVGTSVTSEGEPFETFQAFLPENPHIEYFENRERGYVRVEATPAIWRADLRAVSTLARPEAQGRTLTSWVVESGRAGAQPA